MTDSFYDANFDSSNVAHVDPPIVQWYNGSGDPNHPTPLAKGGFELPAERFGFAFPPDEKTIMVPHSENTIESYMFTKMGFAIVAQGEKQWMSWDGDRRRFLPKNFTRTDGMKLSSRIRFFALARELNNEPVILTFSGTASMNIEEAYRQFKLGVLGNAARLASKKTGKAHPGFPPYAFWFEIEAGPVIKFSQGGKATPPKLATEKMDAKTLAALYVGQDIITQAETVIEQAKDWAKREAAWAENIEVGNEEARNGSIYHDDVGDTSGAMPEPPPNFDNIDF